IGAFVLHAYVSYSKKIDLQSATSHKTHAIFKIADQNALDEHWWAPADRLKIGNVIYAKFSYVTSKEANPSSGLRWLSSQPFNKAFPVTAMLPEIYSRNSGLCLSSLLDLIALDDALVAPADRLKIGKCNLLLSSDVTSKEATLQVVYDVLKLTPFYKAFQVTADAPEIYMQEFWASAYVHNRSVRFKMNNKKHIIGLDQFRDILQIFPKVGNKKFVEPPLEKEILTFLACLGHSGDIRKITDGMYNKKNVDYAYLRWEDFIFQIENKNTKKGNAMYYPRFTKNEDTQLYWAILPVALSNEDIHNSESYKEYYAIASGTIPPKTKGSKKKANTDTITKQKPPTAPKEKKSGKGKQKTTELETIFEADLTKAEQLKIITKGSRQETHSSHTSGSGVDEGTGVTPGVPDAPDYDSEDDISWKSSDDDQDDEQAQDDEDAGKNDVNETTQDDEDDDDHDDDEKVQDDDEHDVDETVQEDDDEEQTESDDDGDDFVHPKLTTHDDEIIHEEDTDEDDSSISSSDEEDSDNDVEGANVAGAKSDEDATDEKDQGNEAVKDTNTDLDGRDKVMTDVEDTHVTLTPVNPDGQQQSSSVSSGFVSNMLNPNQDTGVDDIFRQHTEATSLIDTSVTAIMEPSFTAQINRPPTPHPIVIQTQQPPILTPATTTSSLLQNLPDFASLFGFDHRLKALEDNFSELRQTNQYAEALSSIPSTVEQYLANKMQEASGEDATDAKDQGNEAVKDSNTDLDGRDKVMTDVEDTHVTLTPVNPDGQQQSSSVSSGFVSNMLNPNQDTGVDDIFRQHTEATSLIDTHVTAIVEPSFTRPPTPHPIVIQPQQLPIMTPATTTSSLLENLPNFASLFGFDHRLKALEDNFSEFRQTNQYADALSSIPGTVDQYLANKMQEAVNVAVQLKYDRFREESTSANQQFLDSIDDGMKKIIKKEVRKEVSKIIPKVEKLVTDQLESEVLVRSSKEANTSHAVAANLSELELKKILIDKMEANNSINRSDIQRQLYKVLVEAYEADKILLDTYGDTVTIKRPRDGADDDEEPSAGTDRGSKRRRSGKEPASTSAPSETTTKTAGKTTSTGTKTHTKSASQSAPVGDAMHSTDVFKGPADQEFETGVQDEQAEEEVQHLPDWFQKPTRLPSPDHAWNTSVPAVHETVQPWLSSLAQQDPRESFDELTDSTFDFSAFVLNRLNVQTLTPELLAGPTFELMKGTCKSLTELEYFCEEVYKATTEKLDWINPEGRQYPHDLRLPLPLVPNSQGRRVIPFHHFINNDLEYLRGGVSSRKYSTSVTKTKAADYGHIKWIEDLVPNSMWSQTVVKYDKFALWGISHWVRRDDDALYKFKEGDLHRLRIQDIEDMLLLLVQGKVTNLSVEERIAFNVSLRMFTRRVVIQRRVEDLQLGVESYQKKLNLTKPDTYRSNLRRQDAYTPYSDPRGFIYENKDKKNRLMRIDELHKFSDGTLDDVRTVLNDRLKGIRMEYLPETFWSQRDKANARAMIQAIDKRLKTRRIMRSLERFVGGRPYGGDLRLLQRTI
ncbi:hypothetical protein Tco_0895505, partial [Tanacetum coccineum]